MLDDFLKLKLNRSLFISLIEQNNIYDAFCEYETYRKSWIEVQKRNEYSNILINEELKSSKNVLCSMLAEKGLKFFDEKNYSQACMCFTILIKMGDLSKEVMKNYIECLLELNQNDLAESFLYEYSQGLNDNPDLNKILSNLYERSNSHKDSVEQMCNYMKLTENPTFEDYYNLGRKYLLHYDEEGFFEDISESIKMFNTAMDMYKKQNNNIIRKVKEKLVYVTDNAKFSKNNLLIHYCKKLANKGKPETICKSVMKSFDEIGMLSEYAHCLELITRKQINSKSQNNEDNNITDLIDRYRLIVQIMVYFNIHKNFDEIISCRKYINIIRTKIENAIKPSMRKYRDEISDINKYFSKNLSVNEGNWDLNHFILEIDDKCMLAYLNILDIYIDKKEYESAYDFYNKYCDKFNEEKQKDVPYMLWQLGNVWISLNFYFKAVKFEKLAVEYELSKREYN